MNRQVTRRARRKPSGVFWIGDIPAHWDCGVLRHFAAMRTGHTPDRKQGAYWQDCSIPWFTLADVWQLRDDDRAYLGETKECISSLGLDNSAAELLPAGTVILSRTASVGFSGIMPRPMTTTQDFWNWIPGPRLTSRYLLYLLRAMRPEFERVAFGTTHLTIYEPDAAQLRICVPPIGEQEAIADYLDRETGRLQALIAAKRRILELLAEKRKASIAAAITRGLDPKVKLRDSGVPWLGEIPAHWRSTRVGRLFRQSKLLDYPNLTVLSVYREFGVIERASRDDNANRVPDDLSKYQLVEVGDLVVNKMKAWQGSLGVSDFRGITSPDYVVFRPVHSEDPKFLHSMLRMPQLTTVYLSISNGIRIGQWRIEPERFANVEVFLPPLDEQRAIAEHIARESAKLDAVRAATERTVALLKERRAALIAAAVTGQLGVGAAA